MICRSKLVPSPMDRRLHLFFHLDHLDHDPPLVKLLSLQEPVSLRLLFIHLQSVHEHLVLLLQDIRFFLIQEFVLERKILFYSFSLECEFFFNPKLEELHF